MDLCLTTNTDFSFAEVEVNPMQLFVGTWFLYQCTEDVFSFFRCLQVAVWGDEALYIHSLATLLDTPFYTELNLPLPLELP